MQWAYILIFLVFLSSPVIATSYIGEEFKENTCPLDREESYILGLFLILALIIIGLWLNFTMMKLPFITGIIGVSILIFSLPFYQCGAIIGIGISIIGVGALIYEITEVWK